MISYLGVSVDELVQVFEASFAFSEDRTDREFDEPYDVEEIVAAEDELSAAEEAEDLSDEDDLEDWDDDEDMDADVFVDDEGQIHSVGQTLLGAADAMVSLLTDYIVTDDIDEEWMTLDQARGALLALRIVYPSIEEIPEVACTYSFTIKRDAETGRPAHVNMSILRSETEVADSLTRTADSYAGVITEDSALDELFDSAAVPEAERNALADAIVEGLLTLSEEQCGIVFDVKAFCRNIAEIAESLKTLDEEAASDVTH